MAADRNLGQKGKDTCKRSGAGKPRAGWHSSSPPRAAFARPSRPATPYGALPWPEFIPHFNDYAHLERITEWSTAGGGEE